MASEPLGEVIISRSPSGPTHDRIKDTFQRVLSRAPVGLTFPESRQNVITPRDHQSAL